MSRGPVRNAVEYAGFRVAQGAVCLLPEPAAQALGGGLGWVAGMVARIRRLDVDAHLALAFPERPPAWRRRVARASYLHLGREAAVLLRMASMSAEEIRARTTVEGMEALEEALAGGKGAILAAAHLGNWEIGAALLAARGVPLDVVVKRMGNPRFDRVLMEARRRLGVGTMEFSEAPPLVLRALRRGRVVALAGDQNMHRGGIFVPFFGKEAATARGPALFALRTGAPLFLAFPLREEGRRPRYRMVLRRLEAPREVGSARSTREATEEQVRRITLAYMEALEEAVRAHPEQYFWQHRRWKTRPGQEPGPGDAV